MKLTNLRRIKIKIKIKNVDGVKWKKNVSKEMKKDLFLLAVISTLFKLVVETLALNQLTVL
jgi:hypothetical protein